ncbi:MAG TPA: peroxiredoxin [Patescibacteria group bacterium]|nr:peroxiredoxin [Patescibacteria group bacterium]
MKLNVGDEAPNFILPAHTGETFTLSEHRGSNVVLYFYPKDGTAGCTQQACSFRDSYEAFQEFGAEVVGVSSDSVESHREFAAAHFLPFKLLSDEGDAVRELYGAKGALGMPGRVTYIIDGNGVIRHIFSSQLRVKKHIDEALEILKKLQ